MTLKEGERGQTSPWLMLGSGLNTEGEIDMNTPKPKNFFMYMNERIFRFLVCFITLTVLSFGNACNDGGGSGGLWSETFGGQDSDRGSSVRQASDGGYIVVGTTRSYGAGDYDVWLIKTDANGYEQWSKTFGGVELGVAS